MRERVARRHGEVEGGGFECLRCRVAREGEREGKREVEGVASAAEGRESRRDEREKAKSQT